MVYVDECARAPGHASVCPSISCLTLVAVRPLNVSLGTSLGPGELLPVCNSTCVLSAFPFSSPLRLQTRRLPQHRDLKIRDNATQTTDALFVQIFFDSFGFPLFFFFFVFAETYMLWLLIL